MSSIGLNDEELIKVIKKAKKQIFVLHTREDNISQRMCQEWKVMLSRLQSLEQGDEVDPILYANEASDAKKDEFDLTLMNEDMGDYDEEDDIDNDSPEVEEEDGDSDDNMELDEPRQTLDDIKKLIKEAKRLYKLHKPPKKSEKRKKSKAFEWILRQPKLPGLSKAVNHEQYPNLRKGTDVRLRDNSFFRIETHVKGGFRGRRLLAQDLEEVFMPSIGKNELVWQEVLAADGTLSAEIEISVDEVKETCRIIFTNQLYANLNYTDHAADLRINGEQIITENTETVDINIRHDKGFVEHIREHQADSDYRVLDAEIRHQWRKTTQHGKYTFTDAFCGVGGASKGAVDAGLQLKDAFDGSPECLVAYCTALRSEGVKARLQLSNSFIEEAGRMQNCMTDFLHLSPPCQPFSSANTTPSLKKNKVNLATFLECRKLIEVCKPRIVTVEETFGITWRPHEFWFKKLISWFVELGYSLRWNVLDLTKYGVPQTRDRLILVASGPGESIPPLPRPVLGPRGEFPKLSQSDAILAIPRREGLRINNDESLKFKNSKKKLDGNGPAATIMTKGNGKGVYYYDGTRKWANVELAVLQTFGWNHPFAGTPRDQRAQIGNAIPPVFCRTMFTQLREWLEREDAQASLPTPSPSPPPPPAPPMSGRKRKNDDGDSEMGGTINGEGPVGKTEAHMSKKRR